MVERMTPEREVGVRSSLRCRGHAPTLHLYELGFTGVSAIFLYVFVCFVFEKVTFSAAVVSVRFFLFVLYCFSIKN